MRVVVLVETLDNVAFPVVSRCTLWLCTRWSGIAYPVQEDKTRCVNPPGDCGPPLSMRNESNESQICHDSATQHPNR